MEPHNVKALSRFSSALVAGLLALFAVPATADGVRYSAMAQLGAEEHRLEVRPEAGFEVEVVGVDGAPIAGARAELLALRDGTLEGSVVSVGSVATNAAGRAFLPNGFAQLGTDAERIFDENHGARAVIALAGLYRDRPLAEVDWHASTPARVKLVQPAVGTVLVNAEKSDGEPLTSGFVSLGASGLEWVNSFCNRGDVAAQTLSDSADGLVFDAVELGLVFDVHFGTKSHLEDVRLEEQVVTIREQPLSVRLQFDPLLPMLVGRALLPGGAPLANGVLRFGARQGEDAGAIVPRGEVETDAQGRFEIAVDWYFPPGLVAYIERDGQELSSELQRIQTLEPGEREDLGDIVLEPLELLASGRVVETGRGVAVPLTLFTLIPIEPRVQPSSAARFNWAAVSGTDGFFEFRGHTSAETLLLSTTSDEYVNTDGLQVERGSTDILFELERAGHFTFSLQGDLPDSTNAFGMRISPGKSTRYLAKSGESPPLAPGTYTMQIVLGGSREEVIFETEVAISSGNVTDLGELHFSSGFHHYMIQVELVGEGQPEDVSLVARRPKTDSAGYEVFEYIDWMETDQSGARHLFTTEDVSEVTASFNGKDVTFPIQEGANQITFVAD